MTIKEDLEKRDTPLILDGGLGSQLEDSGFDDDLNDPLWSTTMIFKNPDAIKKVHKDFLNSGADIILTGSYQTSQDGLLENGARFNIKNNADCISVFNKSIDIAFEAKREFLEENPEINRKLYIGGSIGPYGAYLADRSEYTGDYKGISNEKISKFHYLRLKTFLDSKKLDFIAFETIPSFQEFKVIVNLFDHLTEKYDHQKFYYISFSLKEYKTLADGTDLSEVSNYITDELTLVQREQLLGIGSNCSPLCFSHKTIKYLNSFQNLDIPLVIYPNSGEVYIKENRIHLPDPLLKEFALEENVDKDDYDEILRRLTKSWINNGAKIVGGCCRITPKNIRCIHDVVFEN